MNVFIILVTLQCVSGAVFIRGTCPDTKAVDSFNLTALEGTWYEIARYPNSIEEQGDCEVEDYVMNDGVLKTKGRGIFNGVVYNYKGYIDFAANAHNTAVLNYYINVLEDHTEQGSESFEQIYILDVNYDKYILGYKCKYDESEDMHHDFAWIMSKSKSLQSDDKRAVENFMKKSKYLDYSLLIWEHFDVETCHESIN